MVLVPAEGTHSALHAPSGPRAAGRLNVLRIDLSVDRTVQEEEVTLECGPVRPSKRAKGGCRSVA